MKRAIVLLLTTFLLIAACKKDQPAANTVLTGTILLSGISDNNNKPLATFTYNGKLLSKAVLTDSAFAETHLFNYDSQGNLTGTTISSANPAYTGDVRSVITYSAGLISEIKFYQANLLEQDVTFSYVNGQLASWSDLKYFSTGQMVVIKDSYLFTGSNNGEQSVIYDSFYGWLLDLTSFDNKNNVCLAFPLYLYFAVNAVQSHPCIPQFSGSNNPTAYASSPYSGGHSGANITYTYNANNYPSSANTVIMGYNFAVFPYLYVKSAQLNYSYIGVQ